MKKTIILSQIAALLLACPIAAEEPPFDAARAVCTMRALSDFFSQMIVKDFIEKNKSCEEYALDLLPRVKVLMAQDKHFENIAPVFDNFSLDDFDHFMTLKRSDFMKKFQAAEQRLQELKLPTYEKELEAMVREISHQ